MKKILFILAPLLLMASCHRGNFTLEGTLDNGADRMLYLEEIHPQSGHLFIDSIRLDKKGSFRYRYTPPYESFYTLHASENDYIVLIPQVGETVKIGGDINNLQGTYWVDGSPESSLLWSLQEYSNEGVATLQDIIAQYEHNIAGLTDSAAIAKAKAPTDSMYVNAFKQQQQYITEFIDDNSGSLSTLIALYQTFNNKPLLSPKVNLDYYELVLEGLEEAKPNNPHTLKFKNTVASLRYQYGQTQPVSNMMLDFGDGDE